MDAHLQDVSNQHATLLHMYIHALLNSINIIFWQAMTILLKSRVDKYFSINKYFKDIITTTNTDKIKSNMFLLFSIKELIFLIEKSVIFIEY